jgi:hypothetical protein
MQEINLPTIVQKFATSADTGSVSGLLSILEKMPGPIGSIVDGFNKWKDAWNKVSTTCVDAVNQTSSLAASVRQLMQLTGSSAQDASKLVAVMKELGITSYNTAIAMAEKKGYAATTEGLEQIIKTYQSLGSAEDKAKYASDVFGRGYKDILPVLNMSTADFEKLNGSVASGNILTSAQVVQAQKFDIAQRKLNDDIASFTIVLGNMLMGPGTDLLTWLDEAIPKAEDLIKALLIAETMGPVWTGGTGNSKPNLFNPTWSYTYVAPTSPGAGGDIDTVRAQRVITYTTDYSSVLRTLKYNLYDTKVYMDAYTKAIEDGSDADAAAETATQAVIDKEKELQQVVQDRTSWETQYTNAKTAADKTSLEEDLLKQGFESLGKVGSLVWEGYLAATGQISPTALVEFVKIENFLNTELPKIQGFLDRGLSVNLVVKMMTQDAADAGIDIPGVVDNSDTGGPLHKHKVHDTSNGGFDWFVDDNGWSKQGYKAMGGHIDTPWTVVGEQGFEVIDPTGYVHPHGESVGLLAAMSGMRAFGPGGDLDNPGGGLALTQSMMQALAGLSAPYGSSAPGISNSSNEISVSSKRSTSAQQISSGQLIELNSNIAGLRQDMRALQMTTINELRKIVT